MSDDRNETLAHSVESAHPDVEIEREEDRLDDDYDPPTAREQAHEAERAERKQQPSGS